MADWTHDDIPPLHGSLAIITGANSGIGFEAAKVLAGHGTQVVLAVRSLERGEQAAALIRDAHPVALLDVRRLDLSDLESVRQFAEGFLADHAQLPILINNAGIMALPYGRTADGFEMQFGVNHLGHFALTGLLLPALLAAPRARVVTLSSGLHMIGKIDFDNLDGSKGYGKWRAYGQSKLANLLFAYELQRRFERAGARAISVACHPGWAETNLQGAGKKSEGSPLSGRLATLLNRLFAQRGEMGALPTLYAATAPDVRGGDYIGPGGLTMIRGAPTKVSSNARSHDIEVARRLWRVSEELTGVRYEGLE